MRPNKIFDIMDLARRATKLNEVFNPIFIGPPGVGKSHIVQAWARQNELPCIDLRIAYLEAPDLIGFPTIQTVNNRQITHHATPDFLPTDGEGVLLLEEPNRGNTSIMNCLMQLLTDRKIHKYVLPPGWLIAACINPEGNEYDVNTMDAALKDRFEMFLISYDKPSFVEYMAKTEWQIDIQNFVESGVWNYVAPENIKDAPGAKYISPRTLSKLNAALKAGFSQEDEFTIYETILGNNVARDFFNFRNNEAPIMMKDLLEKREFALSKLKKFSDTTNYQAGMISLTVKDIVATGIISDELLAAVVRVIPIEKGAVLIRDLEEKRDDKTILSRIYKLYPEIKDLYRSVVKYGK